MSDPEDSRVNIAVDYENGLVIMRQNPSIDLEKGDLKVGSPTFGVAQDGTDVQVTFEATDPYSPGRDSIVDYPSRAAASTLGATVRGTLITHAQVPGATPSLEGQLTNYPAWEVYSSPTAHNNPLVAPAPDIVYRFMPDPTDPLGPIRHLPGHHKVDVP